MTLVRNKQSPRLPVANKVVTVCLASCNDSKRQSSTSEGMKPINQWVGLCGDWQVYQNMDTEKHRAPIFKITGAGASQEIGQLFDGNPSLQVMYHFKRTDWFYYGSEKPINLSVWNIKVYVSCTGVVTIFKFYTWWFWLSKYTVYWCWQVARKDPWSEIVTAFP